MKKNHTYLIIMATLLVAAVLVIGSLAEDTGSGTLPLAANPGTSAVAASSTPAASASLPALRIGSTLPGSLEFILLNKHSGLADELAKDGTRVEYTQFFTDKGAIEALTAGNIDIAYTSADPVLSAAAGGKEITVIGLASANPVSPSAIIVRPNDKRIFFVTDLKGKKVAVVNGTENQAFLYQALKQSGLTLKDVKLVNADYKTAYPLLKNGEIDALVADYSTVYGILTFDQQVAGSSRTITGRVITTGKEHPGWSQPSVITVNGDFAKNHPDIVKELLAKDVSEAAWADQNYQKTIAIIADATNQKETALLKAYPNRVFYLNPIITDSALNRLKTEWNYLAETGQAAGEINWNTLINTGYLDAVTKN